MRLFIKNMVCPRCVSAVAQLVAESGLKTTFVRLGELELAGTPDKAQLELFSAGLKQHGFELLDDQKTQLIEQVKNLIIQKVQSARIEEHFSVSKFLGEHIFKDYSSVSKLFSGVEGITIEQFFILQKIEKTKELLLYDELSLSQIAFNLGYSSTQHLSSQFKKVTGMTTSAFKKLGTLHRRPIDNIRDEG